MMSGQSSYNQPSGDQQSHHYQSNNPYGQSQSQGPPQYQQQQQQSQQQNNHPQGYAAPPGPPPGRSATFQESDFIPDDERGEQREAMEQFEMSRHGESTEDRDIATLQHEFPNVDGSLIAAIYGDSKSLGATREMLQELSTQT
jgi:hypothetical protein